MTDRNDDNLQQKLQTAVDAMTRCERALDDLHDERQAVQDDQWVASLPYGHLATSAVVEDIDHRIDDAETQFRRHVQLVYRLRIEALRRGLL